MLVVRGSFSLVSFLSTLLFVDHRFTVAQSSRLQLAGDGSCNRSIRRALEEENYQSAIVVDRGMSTSNRYQIWSCLRYRRLSSCGDLETAPAPRLIPAIVETQLSAQHGVPTTE